MIKYSHAHTNNMLLPTPRPKNQKKRKPEAYSQKKTNVHFSSHVCVEGIETNTLHWPFVEAGFFWCANKEIQRPPLNTEKMASRKTHVYSSTSFR